MHTNDAHAESQELQARYNKLQDEFADWKRIWDTEGIIERLNTYTEGYRQRAEALMDCQGKVLKYDRLKQDYDLLQKQYDITVKAAQENLVRAQDVEAKLDKIMAALFPEDIINDDDLDDVPF